MSRPPASGLRVDFQRSDVRYGPEIERRQKRGRRRPGPIGSGRYGERGRDERITRETAGNVGLVRNGEAVDPPADDGTGG
ncbi:hypothetical protein BRD02_03335 [Halobacteriales archaeon QS_8_69_73]|nr:MAG: hypothetical protein BRD02_03335 [Halobacteriales archaeon QS_8_69_73]